VAGGTGHGGRFILLPQGVQAVGVDISTNMLSKARQKLPLPGREVILLQGDAQQLLVDEVAFDMVIFNLILISDGAACLRENLRALKHGGRVFVFDKILRDTDRLILGRRLLNLGRTLFGAEITRCFGNLASGM
jgi:ubiquinone/menaquinone biosynthesis C-methylase UbiE